MKHTLRIFIFLCFFITCSGLVAQSNPEQVNHPYEVIISPNPLVEDEVTFKVSPGQHKLTEIKIYDLIGKEVHSISLYNIRHDYKENLSFLRPGVYFCTVYSDKGVVETKKLMRTK